MIYAVCLYGSEKKLHVSACMRDYMHMCVFTHAYGQKKQMRQDVNNR